MPGTRKRIQEPDRCVRSSLLKNGNYLYAIELGNTWPPTVGFDEYQNNQLHNASFIIYSKKSVIGSKI